MKVKLFLIALLGFFWLVSPFAFALNVNSDFTRIDLKDACTVIVDEQALPGTEDTARMMLGSDQWVPCAEERLARGYNTTERLWLKFDFNNLTASSVPLYLSTYPGWTKSIHVFTFDHSLMTRFQEFGTNNLFYDRPLPAPNFIIPIGLEPNQNSTVLVQVTSDMSFIIGGEILTQDKALRIAVILQLLNGIIIGGIALISLYNLFLFFSLGDTNYLNYFLYSTSMILVLSIIYGFGYQLFWPRSVVLNSFFEVTAGPINAVFMILFVRQFLGLARISKPMDYILQFFMYSSLLAIFMALFEGLRPFVTNWSGVLAMVGGIAVLMSGILAMLKGVPSARFFLIAWIFSLSALIMTGLMLNGIIEFNFIIYYSFGIGVLIEVALLSLALANKIQHLQLEKSEADLAMLRSEIEFSNELAKAAAQLEHKVTIRTSDLAKEKRRAEVMARTDTLTGLKNRRAFFECGEVFFNELIEGSAQQTLSVIMIDIDYFKSVNDQYGHSIGDVVITAVSLSLLPFFAVNSVVGRIGGEEFGVVLKGANAQQALEQAERARQSISNINVPIQNGEKMINVSISLGVTEYRATDRSIDETLARADIALYQAKDSGRNTVVAL